VKKYHEPASLLNIIGCYAQTELGHGSNVAGLETTATLDKTTDEFVIHTPNIKATKFWPGALGLHSTHAIVFARLRVDGKDYGVQSFIVQIRRLEDHLPMPGIKVGDLGAKFGFNYTDNGWLSFDNVRNPHEDIFSRFIEVTKEGVVTLKGDQE
jgi:acyl-CoA oxidase